MYNSWHDNHNTEEIVNEVKSIGSNVVETKK